MNLKSLMCPCPLGLDEMYLQMLSLAEGSLTEAEFADWLRPRVRMQPKHQLSEGKPRYRR